MSWTIRTIAENAKRHPQRCAIVAEDATLTYSTLLEHVVDTASMMRCRGVLDGDLVAIALPRGARQVTTALASMWLGAAFVILDLDEPAKRLRTSLRASTATWLVIGQDTSDELLNTGVPQLDIADVEPSPASTHRSPMHTSSPGHPAYAVLTSGTTGAPKPVVVPHRALDNYVSSFLPTFDRLREEREPMSFASVTSFATDLGHTMIFPGLAAGDSVHLISRSVMMDPIRFSGYMRENRIDILKSTPSHLAIHMEFGAYGVLPRRLMIFGGEPLPWDLADAVKQHGSCDVLNHYGPSETTIGVLTFPLESSTAEHRKCAHVALGKPISNVSVAVVDEELRPVASGESGELLIWGQCVALGYLGATDATRERFIPLPVEFHKPLVSREQQVAYRTGDMVRKLAGGDIEFIGRRDRQVKINGQRAELDDIERTIFSLAGVRNVAVVYEQERGLTAYITVHAGSQIAETLRRELRAHLPIALIPRHIVPLDSIPLSLSGKRDTNALLNRVRLGSPAPHESGVK